MMSMLAAVMLLGGIAAVAGIALGFAAVRWRAGGDDPVADRIDELLPQTQCGQCGFPGCRPYAEALAEGRADIDLCPPGGEATVRALARLLGRDERLLAAPTVPSNLRAVIDEDACVGCAICLQACPVDAIVGAPRRMHTVIADECTGCELCVAPCPVDCIDLVARPADAIRGS